jgi:hypothetical protein
MLGMCIVIVCVVPVWVMVVVVVLLYCSTWQKYCVCAVVESGVRKQRVCGCVSGVHVCPSIALPHTCTIDFPLAFGLWRRRPASYSFAFSKPVMAYHNKLPRSPTSSPFFFPLPFFYPHHRHICPSLLLVSFRYLLESVSVHFRTVFLRSCPVILLGPCPTAISISFRATLSNDTYTGYPPSISQTTNRIFLVLARRIKHLLAFQRPTRHSLKPIGDRNQLYNYQQYPIRSFGASCMPRSFGIRISI